MSTMGHNGSPHEGDQSSRSERWIAVSTDMRFHPLVGCGQPVKPADASRGAWSRYEAWQDLICEAAWKTRKVINKGRTMLLDRGQIMASRGWLAKRWNWTEKQVRGFLGRLEDETMIALGTRSNKGQQNDGKENLIGVLTICKYEIYQTAKEISDLIEGQQRASKGPAKGQRRASEGPELLQGLYLEDTKDKTLHQSQGDFRDVTPKNGAVEVNCVAINADTFSIPFATIDALAKSRGIDQDRGREIAVAEAHAWAANGKPDDITAKLAEALKIYAPPGPEPKRKSKAPKDDPMPLGFAEFWAIYPRKVAKPEAVSVWSRLSDDQRRRAWLAARDQRAFLTAEATREPGKNYCPHPATWLRQGRFDDEILSLPKVKHGRPGR